MGEKWYFSGDAGGNTAAGRHFVYCWSGKEYAHRRNSYKLGKRICFLLWIVSNIGDTMYFYGAEPYFFVCYIWWIFDTSLWRIPDLELEKDTKYDKKRMPFTVPYPLGRDYSYLRDIVSNVYVCSIYACG
ncbi:MAG: hypothetical protein HFI76_00100 [Lachnospiraceae bacterium]|nr:hypothetical protein [Lachnospiraceae bacterium]